MYSLLLIIGHLGKDPVMRYTPSGQAVTSFSVATSYRYTAHDGTTVEETTWYRVTTWGKAAENCNEYLKKGSLVLVQGKLTPDKKTGNPRMWTDDQGIVHTQYEMTAYNVRFLGKPKNSQEEPAASNEATDDEEPINY